MRIGTQSFFLSLAKVVRGFVALAEVRDDLVLLFEERTERALAEGLFELPVHDVAKAIVALVEWARRSWRKILTNTLLAVGCLVSREPKRKGTARPGLMDLLKDALDLIT
jgi:hypothetical protein